MRWRFVLRASLILAAPCVAAISKPVVALAVDASYSVARAPQSAAAAPGEVRREVRRALEQALPATPGERRRQARELLPLYTQVAGAKAISASERGRLQARLKGRLSRLAELIRRDVTAQREVDRLQAEVGSQAETAGEVRLSTKSAQSRGGAPQDDGQALVELIQATIAPQSWDVNGGQGTVKYWPAWHVLVVRQTDDVHEQIGGAIHGLRK